jgi:hypothetical protein
MAPNSMVPRLVCNVTLLLLRSPDGVDFSSPCLWVLVASSEQEDMVEVMLSDP